MQKPRFSIIMPAYNDEEFIEEAIESVLRQTYQSFELVVVDDGSTDNTPAILSRYEEHPKVRIVRQKNGGTAAARNTAMKYARGEYYAFLDSDDFYTPDRLQAIDQFIESQPGAKCLATNVTIWNGKEITGTFGNGKLDKLLVEGCTWENGIVFGGIVIDSQVISKIGGFSTKYQTLEDREMFYRLLANGYEIPFLEHHGYFYRRGQGSNKTASRRGMVLGDSIRAAAKYSFKIQTPIKMRLFCLRSLQYLIRRYVKIKLIGDISSLCTGSRNG